MCSMWQVIALWQLLEVVAFQQSKLLLAAGNKKNSEIWFKFFHLYLPKKVQLCRVVFWGEREAIMGM